MRKKQAKLCTLILATAISSTFAAVPYNTKAMTEKNDIIYITKKDVKKGRVVISKKTAKSIVVRKSVKKATIQLKNVKLSGDLTFEKGEYTIKTSKSTVKSVRISGKETNVRLDKHSDLNKKNFVLKVAKNATGNVDLSEFGKKLTTELGKNSDINIKIGNNDKASLVVKKASISSKLDITGADENSSISKIKVESPLTLTVKVNTAALETTKKAANADITLENKVAEINNNAGSSIADKELERQKEEKAKEEREKAEKEKADKEREEKAKQEKAKGENNKQNSGSSGNSGATGGGSSYTPSTPSGPVEKPATGIALTADPTADINTDGGTAAIKVTYNPEDATNKNIEWTIKEGTGIVKIVSSNANEAKIEALADGNYKIEAKVKGSDVKSEISGKVSGQAAKALKNRIKTYLELTVENINKDNFEDVQKMSTEIADKIKEKITANKADKKEWENYQTKVSKQVETFEAKIKELKDAENNAKKAITEAYNTISAANNIDPATAKAAVENIEAKKKEISEKAFESIDVIKSNKVKYESIKAELADFDKLNTTNFEISDTGKVKVAAVDSKSQLMKVGSPDIVVTGGSIDITSQTTEIDFLKLMRKTGLGKYYVKVTKDFTYLKAFEKKSENKEVMLLEKLWKGSSNVPEYRYDGTKFDLKAGTANTIRLEQENGKWMLKWDAVENATTYDIIAGITVGSNEGNLGAYNLTSTVDNYENVENEFETTPLNRVGENLNENSNLNKNRRTMVAVNHASTSIGLENFIPVKGNGIGNDFWDGADNPNTAATVVDIWIIPRNKNSLYISNMRNYLSETDKTQKEKSNKVTIKGEPEKNFLLSIFKKIFYGN